LRLTVFEKQELVQQVPIFGRHQCSKCRFSAAENGSFNYMSESIGGSEGHRAFPTHRSGNSNCENRTLQRWTFIAGKFRPKVGIPILRLTVLLRTRSGAAGGRSADHKEVAIARRFGR
jgi:hypothetical protein